MTKSYDKRDAFGFRIVNFPFMSSNIPSAHWKRSKISNLCIYNVSSAYLAPYICVSVINVHFVNPIFESFLK